MVEPKPKSEIIVEKYDKNYYHAKIKGTKHFTDDCEIYTTIGRLVFEHQDLLNLKITIESKNTSKTKHGILFNTNPGSSLK